MKRVIVVFAGMMFFASVMTAAAVELSFNGAIDVDAVYTDGDSSDGASDLSTVTVDFGVDAKISDKVSGTILLTNGDEGIEVDTATINYSLEGADLTVGTQTVPFGRFNTNFNTDTKGNDFEIADDSIIVSKGFGAVNVSAFAYKGATEGSTEGKIDDLGIDISFAPAEGIEVGASYASNAYPVDGTYTDLVGKYSVYASGTLGAVGVSAEYIAVTDTLDDGSEPSVYDVEVSYSLSETSLVAASFATGDDINLDSRYGIVYSTELEEGLGLAAEYLHTKDDADVEDNAVTVELSIAF